MRNFVMLAALCFVFFRGGQYFTEPNDALLHQRKANTEIMEGLGGVFDVLTENADIVQRYSHYTNGHTEVQNTCPECYGAELTSFEDLVHVYPDTKPDATLADDIAEIKVSIDSVTRALRSQQVGMKYTLERLRNGD